VDLLALRDYALPASSATAWQVVVSVSSTAGHSRAHGHAESSAPARHARVTADHAAL